MVAKFGVTQSKDTPVVVGLKLEQFDTNESEVDEPFSVVGQTLDVASETDSPGYPQSPPQCNSECF